MIINYKINAALITNAGVPEEDQDMCDMVSRRYDIEYDTSGIYMNIEEYAFDQEYIVDEYQIHQLRLKSDTPWNMAGTYEITAYPYTQYH